MSVSKGCVSQLSVWKWGCIICTAYAEEDKLCPVRQHRQMSWDRRLHALNCDFLPAGECSLKLPWMNSFVIIFTQAHTLALWIFHLLLQHWALGTASDRMTSYTAKSLTNAELLEQHALTYSDVQILHFLILFAITIQNVTNGCSGAYRYIATIPTAKMILILHRMDGYCKFELQSHEFYLQYKKPLTT